MRAVESSSLPGVSSKYEILDEIGHGGMATVYRARDVRLGREVALKVIHRHLRENKDVARRFASEALTVARVKHPNVVEVYDVSGDDETERYLVVELIRGPTLRELLIANGPLPPEVAASIAVLVLRALGHAHSQGVVHRDVKPENVLLVMERQTKDQGESRVKLTDFGIAKLLDAEGVTHTGQVLGSPAHMAPEQIEGGDVDARSDVFGVGVLLYEMLTGTMPFEGKNPAQVLRRVLEGVSTPADHVRPEVGATYAQIVAQALARDPGDRFRSAEVFQAELLKELEALGVQDPTAEVARFLDSRTEYLSEYPERIVEALSTRGLARRRAGDYVGSSVDYNRALAFRPDDTVLLSEVAGLGRYRRAQSRMKWAGKLVIGALLVSALGLAATVVWRNTVRPSARTSKSSAQPKSSDSPITAQADPVGAQRPTEAGMRDPKSETTRSKTSRKVDRKSKTKTATPVEEPVPVGTREVRTPLLGPQNARVRIDGELVSWFQVHRLSLGPHTFEFVPPNSECCEEPAPVTVQIVPGDGPQIVRGTIRFRDAVLRFDGPPGSRASCGVIGSIQAGSTRSVAMSRPEERLGCTIFPAAGAGGEARRIDVDLRPGRTFTLLER
jgi:eukaryotic-like serine/threonine-protein kinase